MEEQIMQRKQGVFVIDLAVGETSRNELSDELRYSTLPEWSRWRERPRSKVLDIILWRVF